MDITAIKTEPYLDQTTGTSGLRKKTNIIRQPHYVENFTQAIFDSLDGFTGKKLVIGGDGRFYNDRALQSILKIAIANQFGHIIVGQKGILSTPATSHIIVKYGAIGGIILSASHNPGGPDGDFGIKFDTENGAPAPQSITDKITARTRTIDRYWTVNIPDIDLSEIGKQTFGNTVIEVIDSVADYAEYMQEIFDFQSIKRLFQNGFTMTYDAMNAVTGPYAKYIFEDILGAPAGTVVHETPLPDFGGLHPEPNLTYAKHLVDAMYTDTAPDFAAASDGDGDRYMILGRSFFLNPNDSLAILTQYLDTIPFYREKVVGIARSMPTSFAVDDVAHDKKIDCYQTPTGWKFFGNLLDAGKITLCGEESFGGGSSHLREKDGIWAILAWLSILAHTGKTVSELVHDLWNRYGRVFAIQQSYEGIDTTVANTLMEKLRKDLPKLIGRTYHNHTITKATEFTYIDPVTAEETTGQGICLTFGTNARIIYRLSGTGSNGATLRVYLNERKTNKDSFELSPTTVMSDLIEISRTIINLKKQIGHDTPTSIT